MRLMCDVVALAIQTDKTRIATMLMCRDLSGLFYPFLGVRDSHHPAGTRVGHRESRAAAHTRSLSPSVHT